MLVLALPIIVQDPRWFHTLIMIGIAIMLTTSLRLSLVAGIFNLGQIAFYAIGAYTRALLESYFGLSFWLCLPVAGIIAGLVALAIGYLTIRVKGVFFLMISLAFVEIVRLTIMGLFGGYKIFHISPSDSIIVPHLFSIEFTSKFPYYYIILALMVITLFVLYRIEKSRIGAVLYSIADNEPLAKSIGINSVSYRVMAFCVSSFFAGIAGAFYATYIGTVGPQGFNIWASIVLFIMIVVGGMGSLWGPVIGAIFLTVLPEFLAIIPDYAPIVYALFVILIFFLLPEGLIGLPRLIKRKVFKKI